MFSRLLTNFIKSTNTRIFEFLKRVSIIGLDIRQVTPELPLPLILRIYQIKTTEFACDVKKAIAISAGLNGIQVDLLVYLLVILLPSPNLGLEPIVSWTILR